MLVLSPVLTLLLTLNLTPPRTSNIIRSANKLAAFPAQAWLSVSYWRGVSKGWKTTCGVRHGADT